MTAYRRWAPALGTGRAPRLLAADPGLRAVIKTRMTITLHSPGRGAHRALGPATVQGHLAAPV